MLIVTDSAELGDKRLNPEETLAKLKEENQAIFAKKKIPDQNELENVERSSGQGMEWRELICRLQRCNHQLQFLNGSPGNIAVYAPKSRQQREDDGYDLEKSDFFNDYKYVSGFPKDNLPEYGHVVTDEHGLVALGGRPDGGVRGWRSVVIVLIRAKLISYKDAIKQFGDPGLDQRASRWRQLLRGLKD